MPKTVIEKDKTKVCNLCNKLIYHTDRYYSVVTKRKSVVYIHWECYNKHCFKDDPFNIETGQEPN